MSSTRLNEDAGDADAAGIQMGRESARAHEQP